MNLKLMNLLTVIQMVITPYIHQIRSVTINQVKKSLLDLFLPKDYKACMWTAPKMEVSPNSFSVTHSPPSHLYNLPSKADGKTRWRCHSCQHPVCPYNSCTVRTANNKCGAEVNYNTPNPYLYHYCHVQCADVLIIIQ